MQEEESWTGSEGVNDEDTPLPRLPIRGLWSLVSLLSCLTHSFDSKDCMTPGVRDSLSDGLDRIGHMADEGLTRCLPDGKVIGRLSA